MGRLEQDTLIAKSLAWSERARVARFVKGNKWLKADADIVEDSVAYGAMRVIENASLLVANTDREPGDLKSRVVTFMCKQAVAEAGRLCRARSKVLSYDVPLSTEEDTDAEKGDFVIYDRAQTTDPAMYCDAMKVLRLAEKLNDEDSAIFIMAADGMTAEEMAAVMKCHPGEARKERQRVTRLINESFIWGD